VRGIFKLNEIFRVRNRIEYANVSRVRENDANNAILFVPCAGR
jgi:hypothetical protein